MPNNNLPDIPPMSADRLTSQLYHLPAIIGRLGLSVANAQKALNADYTHNVKELVALIKDVIPASDTDSKVAIESLLKQLAPSRYQFTETTLDFSADLSESLDVAGSVGLGAGFGAVVINAGLSVGFGRDYRAAARIKTILHALPADDKFTGDMLKQADSLRTEGVQLPPRTEVSTSVNNNLRDIVKMSGGEDLPKLGTEMPLTPLAQVRRAADEAEAYKKSALAFKKIADDSSSTKEGKKEAAGEAKNSANAAEAAAAAAKAAATKVPDKIKDPGGTDIDNPDKATADALVTLAEAAAKDAKTAADEAQQTADA